MKPVFKINQVKKYTKFIGMNRRNFLKYGSMAGLSLPFMTAISGFTSYAYKTQAKPFDDDFELAEITIDVLQEHVRTGKYSYQSITELYLKHIREIDLTGPTLKSVIEINPDALHIAELMDAERKVGRIRSRLHGMPVLIKDNIDTADRMHTTAGSLALSDNFASKDAFLVSKLRDAGAVILGKTNLTEWANFRSTRSVSGWSSRGGQTRNPYILDRSPCGSSSGSAVAVSANLCVVAIGTETDGSVACPASMNGIVGIKPTVGLVSRSGIIPISKTQDTAGPMARTVTDAAILLGIIAGIDKEDSFTLQNPDTPEKDYTRFLNLNALEGKRIGVEKTMLHRHEAIDSILNLALDQMKSKGAEIEDIEFMDKVSELGEPEMMVLEYEFKEGLNQYLKKSNSNLKSLEEIIEFNRKHESEVMPYFKQEIFDSAQLKTGLDTEEYLTALQKCMSLRTFIDNLIETNKLDAICGPATGLSWCVDPINGDFWTGYGAYSAAAISGYPSITVPMGMADHLPVGLSFIGKAFSEGKLLSIAFAFEQASKSRVAPTYIDTFTG
jgi:amidase